MQLFWHQSTDVLYSYQYIHCTMGRSKQNALFLQTNFQLYLGVFTCCIKLHKFGFLMYPERFGVISYLLISSSAPCIQFLNLMVLYFIFLQVCDTEKRRVDPDTGTRYNLCSQENYLLYPTKGLSSLTQILKIKYQ